MWEQEIVGNKPLKEKENHSYKRNFKTQENCRVKKGLKLIF